MLEDLRKIQKVVGIKQSEKAVVAGQVRYAYVACDAHEKVTKPFEQLCRENNIDVLSVETMTKLGHACGIDVGAAVVAVLK